MGLIFEVGQLNNSEDFISFRSCGESFKYCMEWTSYSTVYLEVQSRWHCWTLCRNWCLLYAAQFCIKSSAAEQKASLVAMQQLMSALCCAVLL